MCFKISKILATDNEIYIFSYNFANVGMKPDHNGWNTFVHLYNKKVLKYGELEDSSLDSL